MHTSLLKLRAVLNKSSSLIFYKAFFLEKQWMRGGDESKYDTKYI